MLPHRRLKREESITRTWGLVNPSQTPGFPTVCGEDSKPRTVWKFSDAFGNTTHG